MSYQPGFFPPTSVYPGPYGNSKTLPTGEWNMLANGRIFALEIFGESGGTVKLRMNSGDIKDGRWMADEGLLTFTRVLPDGGEQHFTGYLLHFSKADPTWRIAGTFHQPNLSASSGWYATRPR